MGNNRMKSFSGRIAGFLSRNYLIFAAVLQLLHFGLSYNHVRVSGRADLFPATE